ncbi:hypothetical protein ER308_08780 [Egibacter rhizosphaerae]|uniref:Transposase n=1 Tax=Egibacter rhizosphaerae TaxID=1670831 RepID=A0A411YEL2_9ACTN|nr:hypothetical protein ER308_08780 [Egibacter rhizosphaerae]
MAHHRGDRRWRAAITRIEDALARVRAHVRGLPGGAPPGLDADIDDGVVDGVSSDTQAELAALKRRNRQLEQENEILRRAAAYFAKDTLPK